ncbi:MAG: sigma 54-interacting transcriptional regulator [Spirochaetia bacterium]|nr:sigma 54-interacting transcriptional regulator [Spirochaetia bacterium]
MKKNTEKQTVPVHTNGSHEALPHNAKEIILDTIACGVFTVDTDWKITSFNSAAEKLTGFSRQEAIGRSCREILRGDLCRGNCVLRETLETGRAVVDRRLEMVDRSGRIRPVSISTAVFRDHDGKVIGGLESFRDLTEIEELRKEIHRTYQLHDIISRSPAMGRIFDIIPKIAGTSSTVLIEGESGTGKELAARAIHNSSNRSSRPFIPVNCAALPDSLLESELFGYEKGAFTDARARKKGKIALAEGGTLFLDEIGDISPAFQAKLLRFLQDHKYEPLGAQESLQSDVRVIAATNKDLKEMVVLGSFREDLYYRINVVRIYLPPLRSRVEDIPLLIDHFITRFNAVHGKQIKGISGDALKICMSHSYPGNIRELENAVEYAFVICDEDQIEPRHLPEHFIHNTVFQSENTVSQDDPSLEMERVEATLISRLLAENNYDCRKTAESMGIHRTTLYRKIKRMGIPLKGGK